MEHHFSPSEHPDWQQEYRRMTPEARREHVEALFVLCGQLTETLARLEKLTGGATLRESVRAMLMHYEATAKVVASVDAPATQSAAPKRRPEAPSAGVSASF